MYKREGANLQKFATTPLPKDSARRFTPIWVFVCTTESSSEIVAVQIYKNLLTLQTFFCLFSATCAFLGVSLQPCAVIRTHILAIFLHPSLMLLAHLILVPLVVIFLPNPPPLALLLYVRVVVSPPALSRPASFLLGVEVGLATSLFRLGLLLLLRLGLVLVLLAVGVVIELRPNLETIKALPEVAVFHSPVRWKLLDGLLLPTHDADLHHDARYSSIEVVVYRHEPRTFMRLISPAVAILSSVGRLTCKRSSA